MDLLAQLKDSNNIVVKVSEGFYRDSVSGLNKSLGERYDKICYVSIARPVTSVIKDLKAGDVDLKNHYFVDCVSKKRNLREELRNTVYVESPSSLTKIHIGISKLMREHDTGLIFFDSISSLLIYNNGSDALGFLNNLMNEIRGTDTKGVYLIMRNDFESRLAKELEIFADEITDFNPMLLQQLSEFKRT